jgi:hypothetical protein
MSRPRAFGPVRLALCACVAAQVGCGSRSTIPETLSDAEFWRLSTELSEPAGEFRHSENLVSNEIHFVHTVRRLPSRGGVYIGVGPEQNFSYIARLRPAMSFIVDIRRENRNLHLLYKALFELSADRADFVSRLFSRKRPAGLGTSASAAELFAAYGIVPASPDVFDSNVKLIREHLVSKHRLPLTDPDLDWIAQTLYAFYTDGPDIHYGRSLPPEAAGPSYRTLMTAEDIAGETHSYLATENAFAVVKDLQARNVVVPVVGDFGGTRALRGIGEYVRQHRADVTAFYESNVEVYLNRQKKAAFCQSLTGLPYTSRTWFIDSKTMQTFRSKVGSCAPPKPSE